MRFILNNIKLALNFPFIILLVFVFSCSDKEVKPFSGKKIDIHLSSQSMASNDFVINIDEDIQNDHWTQKGGNEFQPIASELEILYLIENKKMKIAKSKLDILLKQKNISNNQKNRLSTIDEIYFK